MTPGERFQRDPVFHNLVKLMLAQLRDANMTGTEIREAAILAAQMHEMDNTRSVMRAAYAPPSHAKDGAQ